MTSRERMRRTVTGLMGASDYRCGRIGSITSSRSLLMPILLLLLSSGSVRSQSEPNTTTGNTEPSAISEERSGSVVSPAIDSPVDSLPASSKRLVEESGIEPLNVDNNTVVSEISESKGGEVAERGGLQAKEPENAEVGKSNPATKFLPEFSEKEAHDGNGELEDENNSREPTTSPTGKKRPEDKYDKDSSDVYDLNEVEKKSRENNFSLINDTNVNYHAGNREAEIGKEVVILGQSGSQNIDTKPESLGVVSDFDVDTRQPETTTESKLMSTRPVTTTGKNNDTSSFEAVAGKKWFDHAGQTSSNREIIKGERTKDNKSNDQSPRGQTDDSVGSDSTKGRESSGKLNVSSQEEGLSGLQPYPYARGVKIHGDGSNRTDTLLPTFTEEASALENTIGRRENDGGTAVTVSVSESLLTTADGDGTRRAKLPDSEDTGNSWKTSSSTPGPEVKAMNATTPRIESTVSYGAISNVSNFSQDASPDVDGRRGKVNGTTITTTSTTIMTVTTPIMTTTTTTTTPDYADLNNNTAQPLDNFVASVVTDDGEPDNSTLVTAINPDGGTSPSTASFSSDTTTEQNFESRDNGLFLNSTEAATAGAATSATGMVESTTLPSSVSTETLQRFTNETATAGIQETEESSRPNVPIDLTTSGVEYEFIGLTESTVSPVYVTTGTEAGISVLSSSSYVETSTWISTVISSSPDSLSSSSVLTAEEGIVEETTTNPSNTASEMETVGVSTTESLTSESVMLDKAWNETEATTVAESQSTGAGTVTEASSEGPMSATSESGRSVDSSTSRIPEIPTTLENSSTTHVHWTESSSPSTVVNDTWESTRHRVTSESPTFASPTETSPSTTQYLDVNLGTEATGEKEEVTSRPGSRAFSEDDATVLVRIIFEGTWLDVCPYLPILRQSLADLLTSGLEKNVHAGQIIFQKNPCTDGFVSSSITTEFSVTTLLLYVVDKNGNLNPEMTKILPSLYNRSPLKQQQVAIRSFQLVQDGDSGNAIAVVVVSCVALICLVLLAGLLFIMRKRQTRFNYGERCRPVSLDAYSLDSVSAYNSVRGRKAAARASKRSYGNPTFEDSTVTPSHPLNFAGLSAFCEERDKIAEEFASIPQVTAKIDELPAGAEVKNRYANVVPLPETRVSLTKLGNDPLTEYINASYVRGPKNATRYYIACQAPIESTVTDFWRMIWEQQTKVVIMLTDQVENGVEKCAEYVPPSEVTDCHRLYGDYQVTLKKRETKERYAISTLHLKNLENNTFREVSHIWYLWPATGVLSDAAGLIAVLLEARALQRGGPGPVVVHCSPGTGRTGTLIALDLAIRQYEITRTVDVPRVVCTIRRDRAGAVQTKEQYGFIYKALNLYATKLAGGALES